MLICNCLILCAALLVLIWFFYFTKLNGIYGNVTCTRCESLGSLEAGPLSLDNLVFYQTADFLCALRYRLWSRFWFRPEHFSLSFVLFLNHTCLDFFHTIPCIPFNFVSSTDHKMYAFHKPSSITLVQVHFNRQHVSLALHAVDCVSVPSANSLV